MPSGAGTPGGVFRDFAYGARVALKIAAYGGEACRAEKRTRASPERPGHFTLLKYRSSGVKMKKNKALKALFFTEDDII